MDEETSSAYKAGLRDGEILSLKAEVAQLTRDVRLLSRSVALLYGAIAIMQFIVPLYLNSLP